MYQAPEQFVQFSKSSLEAALTLANITLQSTERLMDLQLKTAKEALDQSMKSAKALSDVKNVQDFVALQSASTQPGMEKVMEYSRTLYEVASDAQSRINKVMEARMAEFSGDFMAAVDKAVKTAPAGSETAFAAFKSAMAAANTAYDTMSRAARHATDTAASNAVAQVAKVAKKKSH
jgi:phasin family protein